ncbi:MAG TPA: glycine betaine ABC transporter substrate-binding protein [Burkholderiaceae bacterium]|nr:glycine betaine ABC transporter substrate-binding protein [Burkholderiaceae bacterium]
MRRAAAAAIHWAVALLVAACALAVHAADRNVIRIGWTAWSDAEAVTQIAKEVLETRLGYKVELVMTDIGLQYAGVARGNLDVMLMAWLPTTHKAYWDKVSGEVVDLAVLYDHARLGWAVPQYVPESEVGSIADLNKPEVRSRLHGRIQGIDPGAGLMRASEHTLADYALDGYSLLSASDAGMIVALDRAIKRNEWIVVTTWSPHWMFARYPVRYLADPKGSLGGAESIHAVARKGFEADFPRAAAFLKRFRLAIPELEALMLRAKDSSYHHEAVAYLRANPQRVDQWLADTGTAKP